MNENRRACRRGFTMLETMIALSVLATAAVLAAQLGTWSLIEHGRTEDRLAATDAAANVLEVARARGWADLTPEWAAGQQLTDAGAARLTDGTLAVHVEPEPDRPHLKRVTVLIEWDHRPNVPPQTVTLTGLFADRSTGGGT